MLDSRTRPRSAFFRGVRRFSSQVLFAGFLGLASSCAGMSTGDRGELVIVGGGLRADNALVLSAFTEGAGERVLVLPTASGVPEESGPGTVEDLAAHADFGQSIEVLEILHTTPERADDPHYVDPIRDADALWFTGGDQSRITAVFRPLGVDTPAYRAMVHVLRRGGRVAGSSAGAAMMSDPMIVGGTSRAALLDGTAGGRFELGLGMGFFPFGLVDQHFLRRGRIGRLAVALEETDTRFGWGIADNCALAVDLEGRSGRPLGERAVLQIDARDLERDGRSRRGLRVALLSTGDTIDFATGAVVLAGHKRALEPLDRFDARSFVPLEPFGDDTLTHLVERLSTDPTTPQRAELDGIALVVRADADTRFVTGDATLVGFSATGVLLDLEVDADAVSAARARNRR
ncbi:Cyanophycinase precursor [Planctomycetes bacterium Pla163]|uniref:Cyanophycinase n=1 Tax=Rohdeia mirabilis TaxID=2528008 RepID=A0A518D0T6_9BACT|nr:Cyanophycinase precursor [Planctomycetes bacterium Pla163]